MQQKNFLLFIVLIVLLWASYTALRLHFWPPVPKVPVQQPDQQLERWGPLTGSVQATLEQAPASPGCGNACQLVSQFALAGWSTSDLMAWSSVEPPSPVTPKPQPKPKPEKNPLPDYPHIEDIQLGDDTTFNLKVLLTTRGAGVQKVVLNDFQAADTEGNPAWLDTEKKEPRPLDLVPDNPDNPSNLLYHYAQPLENHTDNPVDTLGRKDWKLVERGKIGGGEEGDRAVFSMEVPDQEVVLTKTYTLRPGDYHIGLSIQIQRKEGTGEPLMFRYQLAGAHGLPIEGVWYTNVYRNALVGQVNARGSVLRDLQAAQTIGVEAGGNEVVRQEDRFIQYAGVATQYFTSLVVVDDEQDAKVKDKDGNMPKILAWVRPTLESEPKPRQPFLDDITVRAVSEPIELKPGDKVVHKYLLYNGPVKVRLLGQPEKGKVVSAELIDRYENKLHLDTLTDYGRFSFWTDIIVYCTNFMHRLLWFLHTYVMPWSYGLCIILLTVLVRGLMFPLSRRQALASAKMQAKMQELAPEVKKLEEKYKNDTMGLQQAKNELYLKRGLNPMATLGTCWVVFLQMPIFLGLYYALQESIHFRLASFLWIRNLAAPDMLIRWGDKIPLISRPEDLTKAFPASLIYLGPYFNLLPIIAVGLMMVQQALMAPPATDEQQAMQQKMMKYMMIFFGLMFYKIAAGLCLYFIASNLWGITERKLLPKKKLSPALTDRKTGGTSGSFSPGRSKGRSPKEDGNGAFQKMRDFWEKVLKEAKKK